MQIKWEGRKMFNFSQIFISLASVMILTMLGFLFANTSMAQVPTLISVNSSPQIISIVANDADNRDMMLSDGDTLTILFDQSTNQPPVNNKYNLDNLLEFEHSLGTYYHGTWTTTNSSHDTLVITVSNATGGKLKIGDQIKLRGDSGNDLYNRARNSMPSTTKGKINGNWGVNLNHRSVFSIRYHQNLTWLDLIDTDRNQVHNINRLPFDTKVIARDPNSGEVYLIGNNHNASLTVYNPVYNTIDTLDHTINLENAYIIQAAFDNNSKMMLVDSTLKLYQYDLMGNELSLQCDLSEKLNEITGLAYGADYLLHLASEHSLYSLNLNTCEITEKVKDVPAKIKGLAGLDDNKFLLITDDEQTTGHYYLSDLGQVIPLPDFKLPLGINDLTSAPRWVDLSLEKVNTSQFIVGSPNTYALTVKNHGPTIAMGPIIVKDTLTEGLSLNSVTGDGWDCKKMNRDVTCLHSGTLNPGMELPVIKLEVELPFYTGNFVENLATVTGQEFDILPDNNAAHLMVGVYRFGNPFGRQVYDFGNPDQDQDPPTNFMTSINDGINCTAIPNITLNLEADFAAAVLVSQNPTFSDVSWESFHGIMAKKWTLVGPPGRQNIFVRFKSLSGVMSAILTVPVIYDQSCMGGISQPSAPAMPVPEPINTDKPEPPKEVVVEPIAIPEIIPEPIAACQLSQEMNQYLYIGKKGDQVVALQDFLKCLGHFDTGIKSTGYFGPITATAVKKFQADHDISQVGMVGPLTRTALNKYR